MKINNYTETSIIAFHKLLLSGKLEEQSKQLLKAYINNTGLTDYEASKILGLEPSTISARRNDLIKKLGTNIVIREGRKHNGEGRSTANIWTINKQKLLLEVQ